MPAFLCTQVNSYKPEIFIDTWGASQFAPSAEDLKAFLPFLLYLYLYFQFFSLARKAKKAFVKKGILISIHMNIHSLFIMSI